MRELFEDVPEGDADAHMPTGVPVPANAADPDAAAVPIADEDGGEIELITPDEPEAFTTGAQPAAPEVMPDRTVEQRRIKMRS